MSDPWLTSHADQLETAYHVRKLLMGEVLDSNLTNNLIIELMRIHKGGLGSVPCRKVNHRFDGRDMLSQ